MNKRILIGSVIIGAVALGFVLSSKAMRFVKNIKYRFSNPQINILQSEVEMDLTVSNENEFDLVVEGFRGKLFYGKDEVGEVTSGSLSLLANESDTTKINVDLSVLNVASTLIQLIQSGQYLNELRVKGTIKVKNPQTGITVSVPYNERVL